VSIVLLTRGVLGRGNGLVWAPNRPAWATVGFDASLSNMSTSYNADGVRLEYDAFQDTDPTAPFSPPDVVRVQYDGGVNHNGTGGGWIYSNAIYAWKRLYMCMAIKFSANYLIHNSDEKFVYPTYWGSATSQTPLTGFRPSAANIGTGLGDACITGILWDQNNFNNQLTGPVVPIRSWFTLCYDMLLNTPEQFDGRLRVYVNGTQVLDQQNWKMYKGNEQLYFRTMRLTSVRGGGDAAYPVPAGGMWRDYDRVVLYFGAQ